MDSRQKEKLLYEYCSNEMSKLKQLCYPKIRKIGGIAQKDYDDLYSIALSVLNYSVEHYDDSSGCGFNSYLSGNISRKYASYIRDKNRSKRCGNIQYDSSGERIFNQEVSLDEYNEDGISLSEIIPSDFNIDNELNDLFEFDDERVNKFLNSLSQMKRNFLILKMDDYSPSEIKEKLNLSDMKYSRIAKYFTSFECIVELRKLFPEIV